MNLQELNKLIYENSISELLKYKTNGIDFSLVDSYTKGNLLISYSTYGYNQHYTQTEMINFLLGSGLNVNDKCNGRNNEKTALHCAVSNNHYEIVKVLIEKGAIVDIKDKNGNTPLSDAVMMFRGDSKDLELIKFLIFKGGSLDEKNFHDISPRDIITEIGLGIDSGFNQKEWDLRFLLKD